MWYYICLVVGAVIGWVLCAICTVAKCDDCRSRREERTACPTIYEIEEGK